MTKEKPKQTYENGTSGSKHRDEGGTSSSTRTSAAAGTKNELVQRLQASLAGRINPMINMGPPPMIHIPRDHATSEQDTRSHHNSTLSHQSSDAGGGGAVDEQYEDETANMTAAERLRFLRRKRQETMFAKEKIVEEDDFMKEFAQNMKRKQAFQRNVVEQDREQQSPNASTEAKNEPTRAITGANFDWRTKRENEEKAAREFRAAQEKQREKEREEQEALERERREEREKQRRAEEQERKREREMERKQEREEQKKRNEEEENEREEQRRMREKQEREQQQLRAESEEEVAHDAGTLSLHGQKGKDENEESESMMEQEREGKEEKHVDKSTALPHVVAVEDGGGDTMESDKPTTSSAPHGHEDNSLMDDGDNEHLQEGKQKHSKDDGEQHHKSAEEGRSEQEEEAERLRLKHERRERRRIAKLEVAVAAQTLESPTKKSKSRRQSVSDHHIAAVSDANEQQSMYPPPPPASWNGFPMPFAYPPHSGGAAVHPPYPFMPQPHIPTPPPSFPMYYPYMPPPPMMVGYGAPSPSMMLAAQPPLSAGMVPTALIPFAPNQVSSYGYYGSGGGARQSHPVVECCEGCKGTGVGLVEKNGFCNHCNRLRLDFIVASARMRQRCSVCGGWGLGLVQASGNCDHCTRQGTAAADAAAAGSISLRRQSTGGVHLSGARATPIASMLQSSAKKVTTADDAKLRNIEWDQSSSDESEWDE